MLKYFWRHLKSTPARDQNLKDSLTGDELLTRTSARAKLSQIKFLSKKKLSEFLTGTTQLTEGKHFTLSYQNILFIFCHCRRSEAGREVYYYGAI